jgi:hypothetical protein
MWEGHLKKMKNSLLVIGLAALWVLGGLGIGLALQAFFDGQWLVPCASLNLIAGMLLLLLITRNEPARRIFYEGPRENEPGLPVIGILWAAPLVLLLVGLIWWLMAQLLK